MLLLESGELFPLFLLNRKVSCMVKKKGFIVDYNKIEREIWALAEPLCSECGAELIDVEYVYEAGSWYLRIFIDREPPVDHALCELVSGKISAALDVADPISQSYYLEVSSPGLERPLKRQEDFCRYAGREILLKLYAPYEGAKEFQGVLKGLEGDILTIATASGEYSFPLESIAKAHLVADI